MSLVTNLIIILKRNRLNNFKINIIHLHLRITKAINKHRILNKTFNHNFKNMDCKFFKSIY